MTHLLSLEALGSRIVFEQYVESCFSYNGASGECGWVKDLRLGALLEIVYSMKCQRVANNSPSQFLRGQVTVFKLLVRSKQLCQIPSPLRRRPTGNGRGFLSSCYSLCASPRSFTMFIAKRYRSSMPHLPPDLVPVLDSLAEPSGGEG